MAASGGYYRNIGTDARKIDFNAEYMPTVSLSQAVLDADIIISLPKFKTHGLTVMTGAIKNSYGFLPGAQKARLHKAAGSPARFHEMIVDVFRQNLDFSGRPEAWVWEILTLKQLKLSGSSNNCTILNCPPWAGRRYCRTRLFRRFFIDRPCFVPMRMWRSVRGAAPVSINAR
jgi:hypothetical protein